jgi:nitrous oxidase accessory protein NosD
LIYVNNFIENEISAYSYSSSNQWNSEKAFSYLYRDIVSQSQMGNFWYDYKGNDSYGSGIGNRAYVNDFIEDSRPLLSRMESYRILV